MLLCIDAGNTNVVFAAFDGQTLKGAWRSATDPKRTHDEYNAFLSHWLKEAGIKPSEFTAAIIASVVPDLDFTLKRLCRQFFNCEPMIVGQTQMDLGIKALLPRPQEVGADRLVNAVAACHSYGPPLIIIDFGTATTFDVVDSEGYRGGAIAPGINLSLHALHMAAAKLPRVNVDRPQQVIGTTTIDAMQSGVYWGYIGLIEGLVARLRAEYEKTNKKHPEKNITVIATGGLSPLFQTGTTIIDTVDMDLTLTGLRLIYEKNKK